MKKFCFVLGFLFCISFAFAQNGAVKYIEKALTMDTVEESIAYLKKSVVPLENSCDCRILYAFIGSLSEQASLYSEASLAFANAAGYSVDQTQINSFVLKTDAKPAELIVYNLLKKTTSVLVLDAVRCSLNAGDSKTALNYLNSSIRNSKNEKILAKIKLYELWARLCDAEEVKDLDEIIILLKAYSSMPSMQSEQPAVLFTLWYISSDSGAADALVKKFPYSAEASVVTGKTSLMPTPFWFFVPRKGNALGSANDKRASDVKGDSSGGAGNSGSTGSAGNAVSAGSGSAGSEKVKRQQVGFFGAKDNAQALVDRLKEKGFKAYIEEEVRPSGNKYFIVIVNENEQGNMGLQLKTAGFDCYPIY